jgi:hypothetical protein
MIFVSLSIEKIIIPFSNSNPFVPPHFLHTH